MKRLAILGAGSWGTALSIVLSPRFDAIQLWAHDPGLAAEIHRKRENLAFLPGFEIPHNVNPTDELQEGLAGADTVLWVTPSQYLRDVFRKAKPYLRPEMRFVSATKGLETTTLQRMSQVIREECPFPAPVATLSGPTFAREVANGEPAALVIACEEGDLCGSIQAAFSGPTFRLYTNGDQTGVEFGGALKNVIAIGAGIVQGLGLGNNTLAALVTRGLAEITRLAVVAGAEPKTLSGLAGLGDLVLTCTGDLSRNRQVGIALGRGSTLPEILASTKMVAEGVETTSAAVGLAQKLEVEMPITTQMNSVLHEGKPPREAIRYLMERQLRSE